MLVIELNMREEDDMIIKSLTKLRNNTCRVFVSYFGEAMIILCKFEEVIINMDKHIKLRGKFPNGKRVVKVKEYLISVSITM